MNYVVISKVEHRTGEGKNVLMSFAQTSLWKTFKYIHWQKDTIPDCHDKKTATYALNKYANADMYEIRTFNSVQKEFNQYINQ